MRLSLQFRCLDRIGRKPGFVRAPVLFQQSRGFLFMALLYHENNTASMVLTCIFSVIHLRHGEETEDW